MVDINQLKEKLKEVIVIKPNLAQSNYIICMTNVLKDICLEMGFNKNNIEILGNRINLKRFYPQYQDNYDKNIIRLLFTGRLEDQKNLHGVTDALHILRSKGYNFHLSICGYNYYSGYLEKCIKGLDKNEYSYFGAVKNRKLNNIYKSVDMYIGPSFFEGFQIPLVEALAAGKPCITSNQPPANEIINSAVGELINPFDANSIAEGILKLKTRLNNDEERQKISIECRKQATEKWSFLVITKKEADIYLKVI